ncbi:phage tail tape measure protein [Deinococcus cellulosilyticus]|uniref:Phage tail tape measure protein domain-containing protein n=1 Tax=Deinococcus cellulosilyticus (strain DSM 18568 / NBRC 106333 / KACC 11606 / 5516J-15) TaxID=1223518 RepID=A0A511N429_DEIC1|nr:phage tail tape measure protein [Deinococcus cellulosilyticus]GEM47218.1 hypothetical protein DC3_28530 [Deinococcus cellulosilyticus NBRC 106333 = KACC 11606]
MSTGSSGSLSLGDLIYRLGFANETEFIDEMERLMRRTEDTVEDAAAEAGESGGNRFGQEFRESALGNLKDLTIGSFLGDTLSNAFQGAIDAAKQFADDSVQEFARYEQGVVQMQLAGTQNIALMEEKLHQLSEEFKVFSDTDFSLATGEMIKAGYSTEQAMNLVRGGAKLAKSEIDPLKGSFLDLGEQVKAVSDITSGFHMDLNDASKATDILAKTVDLLSKGSQDSKLSLAELVPAVTENAATFYAAHINLTQLTATLATAKQNGLDMAEASNLLGSVIGTMMSPPKELKEHFDRLGISIIKSDGTFRSYTEVLKNLAGVLQQGGKGAQAIGDAFDSSQQKLVLALGQSVDTIEAFEKSLSEADGTADKLGATLQNTVIGHMKETEAQTANARRELGEQLAPVILDLHQSVLPPLVAVLKEIIGLWKDWQFLITGTNALLKQMDADSINSLKPRFGDNAERVNNMTNDIIKQKENLQKLEQAYKDADKAAQITRLRMRTSGKWEDSADYKNMVETRRQLEEARFKLQQTQEEFKKLVSSVPAPKKDAPPKANTTPPPPVSTDEGDNLKYTNAQVQALLPRAKELVAILKSAKSAEGIAAASTAIDVFTHKNEAAKVAIEAATKAWEIQHRGVKEGASALEVLTLQYKNNLITVTQYRAGLESIRDANERVAKSNTQGTEKWVKAQETISRVNTALKDLEQKKQRSVLDEYSTRVDQLAQRFASGKITFEEYAGGIASLEKQLSAFLKGQPADSDFAKGIKALLSKLDQGKQDIKQFVADSDRAVQDLIKQAGDLDEAWYKSRTQDSSKALMLSEIQSALDAFEQSRGPQYVIDLVNYLVSHNELKADEGVTAYLAALKTRMDEAATAASNLQQALENMDQRAADQALDEWAAGLKDRSLEDLISLRDSLNAEWLDAESPALQAQLDRELSAVNDVIAGKQKEQLEIYQKALEGLKKFYADRQKAAEDAQKSLAESLDFQDQRELGAALEDWRAGLQTKTLDELLAVRADWQDQITQAALGGDKPLAEQLTRELDVVNQVIGDTQKSIIDIYQKGLDGVKKFYADRKKAREDAQKDQEAADKKAQDALERSLSIIDDSDAAAALEDWKNLLGKETIEELNQRKIDLATQFREAALSGDGELANILRSEIAALDQVISDKQKQIMADLNSIVDGYRKIAPQMMQTRKALADIPKFIEGDGQGSPLGGDALENNEELLTQLQLLKDEYSDTGDLQAYLDKLNALTTKAREGTEAFREIQGALGDAFKESLTSGGQEKLAQSYLNGLFGPDFQFSEQSEANLGKAFNGLIERGLGGTQVAATVQAAWEKAFSDDAATDLIRDFWTKVNGAVTQGHDGLMANLTDREGIQALDEEIEGIIEQLTALGVPVEALTSLWRIYKKTLDDAATSSENFWERQSNIRDTQLEIARTQYELGTLSKEGYAAQLEEAKRYWQYQLAMALFTLNTITDKTSEAYAKQLAVVKNAQDAIAGISSQLNDLDGKHAGFDPESFKAGLENVIMDFGSALVKGINHGDLAGALKDAIGSATDFFMNEMMKAILGPIAQSLASSVTSALTPIISGNPLAALGIALGVGLLGSLLGGLFGGGIQRPPKTGREAAAEGTARTPSGSAPNIHYEANTHVTFPLNGSLSDPATRAEIRTLASDVTVDTLKRLGLIK